MSYFKESIDHSEYETALEFDVHARIIKDGEGNDIQAFIKEDKRNGLRRDSSFYWDGSWEVFEFDDAANETRFRASSGTRALSKYDNSKRLKEYYIIDKNEDTLTSERYEWKNGRLVRMTANGVARNYIYGKTLQDTVRVIPSDEGLYFHPGYNNSIGEIPDEKDQMYEYFAMDPYSGIYTSNNKNGKIFLGKLNAYQFPKMDADIPKPTFMNPSRDTCRSAVCPNIKYPNGHVNIAGLFLNKNSKDRHASCEMDINLCSYRINYGIKVDITEFEIVQSELKSRLIEPKWDRYCRTERELQDTYDHEKRHILNAKKYATEYANEYMPAKFFFSNKDCEESKKIAEDIIFRKFNDWKRREYKHSNPDSPQNSLPRIGEICDVD